MAIKSFWIKLIKSIDHNYLLLENFLYPGKCYFCFEFSSACMKIINILIQKKKGYSRRLFFTGHLLILKCGSGLIFLGTFVFKVQKLEIRAKQNLIGIIEKYSTTLSLVILNNYFKIFLLFTH